MVDVGEIEHLDNLILSHAKGSEDQDLHEIETYREKITQVRQRESSEIEKGNTIEARSTNEEHVGNAAKYAKNDEDGADDSIGDALNQPLVIKAGRLEERL